MTLSCARHTMMARMELRACWGYVLPGLQRPSGNRGPGQAPQRNSVTNLALHVWSRQDKNNNLPGPNADVETLCPDCKGRATAAEVWAPCFCSHLPNTHGSCTRRYTWTITELRNRLRVLIRARSHDQQSTYLVSVGFAVYHQIHQACFFVSLHGLWDRANGCSRGQSEQTSAPGAYEQMAARIGAQ